MKEVKIYTIVSDQLSPPITGESFCTDMVRHSDYADLEEKCAALAAENAGLKAAIDSTIGWQQSTDPVNVESVRMLVDIETPATDAFLAEVRAQGVEMFADKYRSQLTALPTTPENIFDAAHVSLRYQIFDADEFASKLRKGGAA
ncbi:hypothetical protein SR03_03270 [Salmonella enterica subsp. enterica serovar Brandenburg]|uniref:hypothetical protein n=1 Tax=Salmonella enterica TaxID=28901 RepID=UPI0009AAA50E|nr:hypothetical protein [Salmonella enterica]EAA9566094.1 hypothetical protein [Salmonella enterica subsp. enterica]EBK1477440.1 hypothetical protein [Salmonella enterica subsp. enterica serovar Brandenburg]EBV6408684.1 hypothetical protein [Salmonella enterica subsp. enterica serovar Hadar]ECB3591796.1 hypothetical protein [Salmonella enterica subsp. enterica serovar 4,[5],12:i:-]EHE3081648.1 hypothetical protein [Salmonella enterica subsp. enterica serovar California]HAU6932497.1 hypothetic